MGIVYPPDIFTTVQNYPSEFLRTPKHVSSKAQFSPNLITSKGLLSKRPTTFAILRFVLKVLKIVGQCPFGYERDQLGGAYSFSWTSFDVIQSFVVAIIASFGWFTFLTHHGLKKFLIFSPGIRHTFTHLEQLFQRSKTLSAEKVQANVGMFRILLVFSAAHQLSIIVFSWINRHRFVKMMNGWALLHEQLERSLGAKPATPSRPRIHFLFLCIGVLYVVVPTVLSVVGYLTSTPMHENWLLEVGFLCLLSGYTTLVEALNDIKVVLIFNELTTNFEEVTDDLRKALKDGSLSGVQIKSWRKLLITTRKQASMVSSYLVLPELGFLLQCVLQGTICVFLTLTNAYGGGTLGLTSYVNVSYVGLFIWKLCCRAVAAERVSYAEKRIIDELTEREFEGTLAMEAQLKDLRDMLVQQPVEINLANIVVLRKRLVLLVAGHILTYLIVLIQFYNQGK